MLVWNGRMWCGDGVWQKLHRMIVKEAHPPHARGSMHGGSRRVGCAGFGRVTERAGPSQHTSTCLGQSLSMSLCTSSGSVCEHTHANTAHEVNHCTSCCEQVAISFLTAPKPCVMCVQSACINAPACAAAPRGAGAWPASPCAPKLST